MSIREQIEEIEKTRDSLMSEVRRLDYLLTNLYQKESEDNENDERFREICF